MHLQKKIIISAFFALLLLAAAWAVYAFLQKESESITLSPSVENNSPALIFMETEEKIELGLQESTRVQVLGRDENGEVVSYKIIRNDEDVITDLESLKNKQD